MHLWNAFERENGPLVGDARLTGHDLERASAWPAYPCWHPTVQLRFEVRLRGET